tara:strand:+ start:28505 stop:31936 length:3432 start_codon:yes stop_codon:yes gene_type:complete
MKFKLSLLTILFSIYSYSQCFDCGHSIGGHVEDYVVDIDKTMDGIILTINPNQGWGRSIYKYDFNCNLLWSNNFELDNGNSSDGMSFFDTTVDDNNNIYSIISNSRGGEVVEGFTIERGNSLIKMNANGNIEWIQKISDEYYLKRKIHFWKGNIYVVGQIDPGISTNIGLTIPNGLRSQYFIAKFDLLGNLNSAEQFGGNSNEIFLDSQIDENGNIYFTGLVRSTSSSANVISLLNKVDSNLGLIWSRELSNNPPDRSFSPMTLYYNNSNGKLYVWSKYYISANFYNNNIAVSNDCDVGSVVMEISKSTGDLENYKVIDNCGFLGSVGNGTGNVEQKSFITHEGSNLYILSSFRGEITIGSETLSTTQTIHDEYNSDLLLHKIDLTNFSSDLILKSNGENYYPSSPYYDLAGPIIALDNSVYITSSFMSYPITINDNTIVNNSGNNNRDILFYKHILDQTNLGGSVSYNDTCYLENTKFSVTGDFDSVLWDFDDPTTGTNNTSTVNNPAHLFSQEGTFNVTVNITCGTQTETISTEVTISSPPIANLQPDLFACENFINSGISSDFDTSNIQNQITGNQTNITIEYYDKNAIQLSSPLPNPMTNTIQGSQQITARIFFTDNSQCYSETTFNLIVQPLPELGTFNNLNSCDLGNGFSNFDLTTISSQITSGGDLEFYDSDFNLINNTSLSNYENIVSNLDLIYVRLVDSSSNCYSETSVNLIVNLLPVANTIDDLIGCDDDNDGFSESFSTSLIESQVLGGQPGMIVTYYDQNNNLLQSPLPNPYTNINPFNESIRVRVTNPTTNCFNETSVNLITSTQPNINQPNNVYACNEGNGFSNFNIPNLATQIIGNQTGLNITYFDAQGNNLTDSFPQNFQNTVAYDQLINVRVENANNSSCYSETSFHLLINELPTIELQEKYIICDLQESLTLNVSTSMNSYEWVYEDGTIVSKSSEAMITLEGSYILEFTEIKNGIECENKVAFELIRSELPQILNVDITDLSDNNSLKINATGDGEFEYSIDGSVYQDNNIFENLTGGVYTAYVRDKNGCGEDSKEVIIIDYPVFFTPNNDGINDFWQIKGINKFPNSKIFIFDRYGKLLTQLSSNDLGWGGLYHGKKMSSNDYWFKVDLGNGTIFSGHFALMR